MGIGISNVFWATPKCNPSTRILLNKIIPLEISLPHVYSTVMQMSCLPI